MKSEVRSLKYEVRRLKPEARRRGSFVLRTSNFVLLPLLALLSIASPLAQTTIKLATVVPQNSIWDKNLKQMADEWKQATGGRYDLTIYAGGTQGDEPMVLRKMRVDALQAAAFTNFGLGMIDPAFNVFNIPFFFDSYD